MTTSENLSLSLSRPLSVRADETSIQQQWFSIGNGAGIIKSNKTGPTSKREEPGGGQTAAADLLHQSAWIAPTAFKRKLSSSSVRHSHFCLIESHVPFISTETSYLNLLPVNSALLRNVIIQCTIEVPCVRLEVRKKEVSLRSMKPYFFKAGWSGYTT